MLVGALLGCLFGFVGSIPVTGPVAALMVARGLAGRYRSGAYIAIGSAAAEAAYAFAAFYGMGSFVTERPWVQDLSQAGAAVLLFGIGGWFVLGSAGAPSQAAPPPPTRGHGSFALGFGITVMNPMLIATWTAVATVVFSTGWVEPSIWTAGSLAFGACIGIILWMATLLSLLKRFRGAVPVETLNRVRRVTGAIVLILGVYFAFAVVTRLFG